MDLQNKYFASLSSFSSLTSLSASPRQTPMDGVTSPPMYPYEFGLDACAEAVAAARPVVFCRGTVAVPVASLAPGEIDR